RGCVRRRVFYDISQVASRALVGWLIRGSRILFGDNFSGGDPMPETNLSPDERAKQLSPRLRETLQCLLDGNSEKSIAKRLTLSPHTVHGYVKLIYRHFRVKSRAQLLSQWVRALKLLTLAWALAT